MSGFPKIKLREFDGPLTSQLVRDPSRFGLASLPKRIQPTGTTTSVCGYCSTGCSLSIHLKDGEAVNLSPSPEYPVNIGMACPKGWEALTPMTAPDRGTTPLVRQGDEFVPLDWQSAAETFRDRMQAIQKEHGKESAAFLSTGQICTEEMALLVSFAKFEMGMMHGDGNTRQCMATSVVAYKESFGFDAPPYTYEDFEESDVIVLIGSNLCIAHPIMWQRVLRNKRGAKIVVIDPRFTETAAQADLHLQLQPKSDLKLFYGIAARLIELGDINQDYIDNHTSDFDEFADHVAKYSWDETLEVSGIDVESLNELIELIGAKERVSFWWTMGVNQGHESTATAQAIINLALMTGNIGRPGTGANSITGQCNAMGSRLFSNTTNLLGGHDFANPEQREKVSSIIEVDEERIPNAPSWSYDKIISGIESGEIKALWVIATNGAHSWIQRSGLDKAFEKLEFLVVQDLYPDTETAKLADLYLPAAGWGEKEGTFINSERRIGITKKVRRAPGEALADFSIFRLLAKVWSDPEWLKNWSSPEDAFTLLQRLSEGQPCDISGVGGYQEIDAVGGMQWPVKKDRPESVESQRRLFEDGKFYTPDNRARFVFSEPSEPIERPDEDYPFTLLTGRGSSAQWHTLTRTKRSPILQKLSPDENYIEIHPADAKGFDVVTGDLLIVSSRRGKVQVKAIVTASVAVGQVFMPMHFAETNLLTAASFDPKSRQPSYKYCAVSVSRV
ncbi:MAG: nitrate reductase [Verrucomicrobiota bacterium]